ncbi:MAG: DNA-directed RNA polymerase subunit omega [Marinilabiliaceae bacterium]|nr:DNA-directed RNA polymerase subunit omega [Marinilabiliaceae bacterium]
MEYKKLTAPLNTITWDTESMGNKTGNVYESVMIMAKRANQISKEIKEDLGKKLGEFTSYTDNLEEVFENREQIEISKYYERLPKPSSIAAKEFTDNKIYYRNPSKDKKDD